MSHEADFDARLHRSGVAFTARDAALLEAVDDHASLNAAASALGRSYSRSQRRVVELEDAFDSLVERQRGGPGGGGSTLTDTARDLLADFERLEVEFTGVAEAEETVLRGTVADRDGELATVETAAGPVRAIVPANADAVRVVIRADAVTLHAPESLPESDTSARNRFEGQVTAVESGETLARVTLDIGIDTSLVVLVTETSVDTLNLASGTDVVASFKATATRAFPDGRAATDRS